MIPKGLKVGDTITYCDGNVYEVTAVIGDQYQVRRVGFGSPVRTAEKEKANETDYNALPYFELKKLCAERGLDANGKKTELVARLQ